MHLSISNIAWDESQDSIMYSLMGEHRFTGLEIAPTRVFKHNPYDDLETARKWAESLKASFGFTVPSMQSIWYGKQERIFGSEAERNELLTYTKKAIDFAAAIGCGNLVFGCPRNRNMPEGSNEKIAVEFFEELAEYALGKGTVIAMEANPPIYNTNYINDTPSALNLIRKVNSEGFRLNLDVGTMIHNGESADALRGAEGLINHVHISEPGLQMIRKRKLHKELAALLHDIDYQNFISIEVGKQQDISALADVMKYVGIVFE